MAIRSTTSANYPPPPNYTAKASRFYGMGKYQPVSKILYPKSARYASNMCTAPTSKDLVQYRYIPGMNG